MFSVRALKDKMQKVFVLHGSEFVETLQKLKVSGETFDLQNLLQCLTFDIICDIAFGVSAGTAAPAAQTQLT